MPTAKQYADHSWMIEQLDKAQTADHDNREKAREAFAFVNAREGQWEQMWLDACDGRPRYEFDLCNPLLDRINASISSNDYDIKVLPSGGDANEDCAEIYGGLIRHIEAISNAGELYDQVGRSMALKGSDGWEVVQAYVNGDSFDQDLMIKKVPNWIDRVWLGPHTEQDGSDCKYGWKLTGLTKDEYADKYGEIADKRNDDRKPSSVNTDRARTVYSNRHELTMVGTFYYLKPVERELVQLTNGKVYATKDFEPLREEHEAAGITVQAQRTRTQLKMYVRVFDNDGWLGDEQETVFANWLTLVPCYANFDYAEDKVIYWGAVEKMLDWQRVYNYSMSREIEEAALAPRPKYWATPKQIAGFESSINTLNTNSEPLQLYNPDPEAGQNPPPYLGGPQINPQLRSISETMQVGIGMGSGLPPATMGNEAGYEQSGVAIKRLQNQGDEGSNKYIAARSIAQRQTGRILVDAIPRVYTPGRVVRVLAEDGTYDMECIGQEVLDEQTGKLVILNDLTEGQYDVTCAAGPSFQTRQGETVNAMVSLGTVDPSVIQTGGDVIAKNINAPGMDIIAKRKRRQLFMAGQLLPAELTNEERAEQQQMQGQQQPDPNMVLAMAERQKAEADLIAAQTKQIEAKSKAQLSANEIELKQAELQIKAYDAETARYKAEIDKAKAMAEIKGKHAQAAKDLADAEAQDIENDAVQSGIHRFVTQLGGANG